MSGVSPEVRREQLREADRRYRAKHAEKLALKARQRHAANPEKARKKNHKYYHSHALLIANGRKKRKEQNDAESTEDCHCHEVLCVLRRGIHDDRKTVEVGQDCVFRGVQE